MSMSRPFRGGKLDWRYWPSDPTSHQLADADTAPEDASHLELEDDSTIAWGLAQCEKSEEHTAIVDALEVEGGHVRWRTGIEDDELESIISHNGPDSVQGGKRQHRLLIIFLKTSHTRSAWLPGNFTFRARTLRILRKNGLSGVLLGAMFNPCGGWASMSSQCFTRRNHKSGNLSSFEVCYQYVCGWGTGKSFIQFVRDRHQTTYFCINYHPRAFEKLQHLITRNPKLAFRDYLVDALAADECVRLWKEEISQRRDKLLFHEKVYVGEDIDSHTATRQLHKLAYNWHTLRQDCTEQLALLNFLHKTYEKYMTQLQAPENEWEVDLFNDMGEVFEALKSSCDNCVRWTNVYQERTNIRINLLFNLTAQTESRTSTEIAASTAKVAEQTQRDSASMITIAAVTMFFLPGTFICAVLSTTFFDYAEDSLRVSSKWWILPASTIPMTAAVFVVWVGWRWWKLKNQQKRLTETGRGLKLL